MAEKNSALFFFNMRNVSRSLFLVVVLFTASVAFGGVPPLNVTVVSAAGGKASYKGVTDSKGYFATANLPPGSYAVQLVRTVRR